MAGHKAATAAAHESRQLASPGTLVEWVSRNEFLHRTPFLVLARDYIICIMTILYYSRQSTSDHAGQ
jgi:hypothetical protein